MTPKLTVIIPTYNRTDLLGPCLDALAAQTFQDFAVFVVDDGSQQDIAAFVKGRYPEATVLRRVENGGFAKAVNAGIQAAQSDLVLLLNNDTVAEPEALRELVVALEREQADLAAPLMVFQYEPQVVYGCGDRLWCGGRPESIGHRVKRERFSAKPEPFGVSAGAGLYRSAVFETCGLFDETFVAYFEDSDLNCRARLRGFRAIAVPEALIYHAGSSSLEGRTWWRTRQCFRNHGLLVAKNYPLWSILRFALAIGRERLHQRRRFYGTGRPEFGLFGTWRRHVGVSWEWMGLIPHVLRERRRIQRNRRISIRAFHRLLTKGAPE